MRFVIASVVLLVVQAGCGSQPAPQDLSPGNDAPISDGGGSDGGGGKAFGAPCMMGAECASGVCFVGGNRSFCSFKCTPATQATDCPNPPTSGTCNLQGFCKP